MDLQYRKNVNIGFVDRVNSNYKIVFQTMPGRICAVAICKNNQLALKKINAGIIFHRFPKAKDVVSSAVCKEWVRRCKRADKFNVDASCVCSAHFTSDDYERDFQNELLSK